MKIFGLFVWFIPLSFIFMNWLELNLYCFANMFYMSYHSDIGEINLLIGLICNLLIVYIYYIVISTLSGKRVKNHVEVIDENKEHVKFAKILSKHNEEIKEIKDSKNEYLIK